MSCIYLYTFFGVTLNLRQGNIVSIEGIYIDFIHCVNLRQLAASQLEKKIYFNMNWKNIKSPSFFQKFSFDERVKPHF